MPGTNLTRDEAATRAALLDVDSYAVDLDLTTGEKTFGSTTTIRFTCREPGSGTFVDLVGATVHSITLNGDAARPRHGVRRQPDRADRPRRRQRARRGRRLQLQPHAARACTASSTRSTTGSTCYSQFEVPDARRVYATFEQPDLKSRLHLQRDRARPLEGGLQRADARSRSRVGDGAAVWRFPHDQADVDVHHRGRRRRVPRGARHLRGQARHHPAGPLLPPVAGRAPRPRRAAAADPPGLRVLRGASSTTRTPSRSTTSSTCRSTTWARWRTPAA